MRYSSSHPGIIPATLYVMKLDILIFTAALCVGLALSVVSYIEILNREGPLQALVPAIPAGEHRYLFTSANTCVGEGTLSMKFADGQYRLVGAGQVALQIDDIVVRPTVSIDATFNAVGQLGGGVVQIRHEGVLIKLGTKELNPIRTIFEYRLEGATPQRFETLIPGPITIKANSPTSYRVEYLHFGKIASQYGHLLNHPLAQKFALTTTEISKGTPYCNDLPQGGLDIGPLAGYLQRFSKGYAL
jgi:hypothetical protein